MFAYIDNIIIASLTNDNLDREFMGLTGKLRQVNMRLHPGKTQFYQTSVTYLSYVITSMGIRSDPRKLQAIAEFPTPEHPKNIKQFTGMTNYYWRLIENYLGIARLLYDLSKKNIKFVWNEKAQTAFMILKELLTSEPILRHPDFSKPFYIVSNANIDGIGEYLSQKYEEIYHPISYT